MSFLKRIAGTDGPKPIPPLTGVPVFGEDEILARVVAARDHALPLLEAADTPEARLKGLLLLTNMSKRVLDRTTALMEGMSRLSAYDPGRKAAANWTDEVIEVISDTNEYVAEQKRIVAEIGSDRAERVLEEVRDLAGELLDPPRGQAASSTEELEEPAPGIAVFGDSPQLVRLVRARNDAAHALGTTGSDEARLVALVVFNNSSKAIVDRLGDGLPTLGELPATTPGRDEALAYARRIMPVLERWTDHIPAQEDLVARLGRDAAEAAVAVANKVLNEGRTEQP